MTHRLIRNVVSLLALLIIAIFIALLIYSQKKTPHHQHEALPSDKTIKIATYNINFGNNALDTVQQAILEADPDIIALQETTYESESYLKKTLKDKFPYITFQGFKGMYYAERFGFLSKYPILEKKYIEPKFGIFGTYYTVFEIGERKIQLANVHLQPPNLFQSRNPFRKLKIMIQTKKNQVCEIRRILDNRLPDIPTIILGDFNSLDFFDAPGCLRDSGFIDSAAQVMKDDEKRPTWQWQTRSGEISARIDYIFHDRTFRTIDSRVIDKTSSDHHLLVSQLRLLDENNGNSNNQ